MTKISILAESSSRHDHTAIESLMRGKSGPVAAQYGVSSRAIRDIWNRKTWADATEHLWHLERDFSSRTSGNEIMPMSSVCNSLFPAPLTKLSLCLQSTAEGGDNAAQVTRMTSSSMENNSYGASSAQPVVSCTEQNSYEGNIPLVPTHGGCSLSTQHLVQQEQPGHPVIPNVSPEMTDPFHGDWPHW